MMVTCWFVTSYSYYSRVSATSWINVVKYSGLVFVEKLF